MQTQNNTEKSTPQSESDLIRWKVVSDGLRLVAFSIIAVGAGLIMLILGGSVVPATFPGLDFVAISTLIIGLCLIAVGGLVMIVGFMHCLVAPESISRMIMLVLILLTIYSAHNAFNVQQSMIRFKEMSDSSFSSVQSRKSSDKNTEAMIRSFVIGNRSSAVLNMFSGGCFLTSLLALMSHFRQPNLVRSIQKLILLQVIGGAFLGALLAALVMLVAFVDAAIAFPLVMLFGLVTLAFVVCCMVLMVKYTLESSKVIASSGKSLAHAESVALT